MIDPTNDPRIAGQVKRYHTWPVLQSQTNAAHSWQVARILLAIYPECDRSLLVHALNHDSGELHSGDLPYPVKKENPELKTHVDRIENRAINTMHVLWDFPIVQKLDPIDKIIFKIAEFIEMYEFGAQEVIMGNKFGYIVAERCITQAQKMASDLFRDHGRGDIATNIWSYIERREKMWKWR